MPPAVSSTVSRTSSFDDGREFLGRNKKRKFSKTKDEFSDPTHRTKRRPMDGAQFHPPWVGDAGGELGRNKKRKFSKTKDEFSDPTHRTKRRPMDGAQFHPPWVGDAGGELTRTFDASC